MCSSDLKGLYATDLRQGEILAAAEFPALAAGYRSRFAELARRHGDYAMVGLAAHARVSGEMVVELANAFVDYWNVAPGRCSPHLEHPDSRTWSTTMRVHRNIPTDMIYPIRNMYLEAIDRADERILLTEIGRAHV